MMHGREGGRAEGPSAAPSHAERREGMRDSGRAAGKAERGERQTIGQGRGDLDNAHQSRPNSHTSGQTGQTVGQSGSGRDNTRASQSEQEKHGKGQTIGQSRSGRDNARQSTSDSDKSAQKDQTVGQGRNDRTRQSQGAEQNNSATTGANTKGNAQDKNAQGQSTTTTGANTKSNAPSQAQGSSAQQNQGTTTGANTQTQAQGGATQSMSGRVQVNAQQQTRLQQSVLNSRNVERVRVNQNAINFRVDSGVVVPRNISVVSVSAFPALIDVYPDYRDDSFFVVDDEIVVTDRSRRIVDVIPAGPRTHFAHRGSSSGSGGSVAALDLSPDEIRVVQRVLIERGLLSGEADGVLGPDTRAALISFQRQEGFQATGSIDTRTVTALGVSNQISATRGQSTTVGQGRSGESTQQNTTGQNTTGQGTGQANAPAQPNQTTGQAGQNQPSTSGQAQQNQPTTPGEAGTNKPSGQTTGQAPAQNNTQPTNQPGTNQNTQSGQTNQNNAPPPSTSGQAAQKPGR